MAGRAEFIQNMPWQPLRISPVTSLNMVTKAILLSSCFLRRSMICKPTQRVSSLPGRSEYPYQDALASTASCRTTRFGSSSAFPNSLITEAFEGCRMSYRTIDGIFCKNLRADILTLYPPIEPISMETGGINIPKMASLSHCYSSTLYPPAWVRDLQLDNVLASHLLQPPGMYR